MSYQDFLRSKMEIAKDYGFCITDSDINPALKPHQRDAVRWAIKGGRRALFESFGLGKTCQELEFCRIVTEKKGGKALIVLPLGVKQEFTHDAVSLLGIPAPQYVRTMEEVEAAPGSIMITNYERVRDGDINPQYFTATSLDEASVLRSYGSKTYQTFLALFKGVPFKLVATATPSPNKFKELIHYAGYLEIMDTGQALTRFFRRDSTKANNLTLYPHKENEFWLWVSTWALYLTKPSDMGYDDAGYDLPPMRIHYHEIPVDHLSAGADKWGQNCLFREAATGLKDAAKEKRDSIKIRVDKIMEIVHYIHSDKLSVMEAHNENATGSEPGILREESRSREEALPGLLLSEPPQDRSREKEGLHGGISQDLQTQKEDPGADRGAEPTAAGEVRDGRSISAEDQWTGERFKEETPGNESPSEVKGGVQYNYGAIRRNIEEPGREVRDLWDGQNPENQDPSLCGPRSQNEQGSGDSLPSLQLRDRSFPGQPGAIEKCDSVSEQIVIWCDLNTEQKAIEVMLKGIGVSFSSVTGSQSIDEKERLLQEWKDRKTTVLLSKAEIYGSGANLQQACKMIFAGIDYKFNGFIQCIHRVYRFMQTKEVDIHILHTESEREVLKTLLEKWEQHNYMVAQMVELMKKHGLSSTSIMEKLGRSMGVERVKIEGKNFTAINNDCIIEAAGMEENSIDLIHTSIPFSNHYEYTPSYNDFGHNQNTVKFFEQMDFLTPNLLRVLKPGRVFACHVKDRVLFGNATGTGMPTIEPFHVYCVEHYIKHGFQYFGMITVVTDVVRENNQTYRLGWTECTKDGSKMGVGCPEYILLFRKLPTDTSTARADVPVEKTKEDYTRAQWQIDAHSFWRSSGDRLLSKEELKEIPTGQLQAIYRKYSRGTVYSYKDHVALAKKFDEEGRLPASFMVVSPGSWTDDVWDDINRMRTLNTDQARKNVEMHVCPLQFDIVERIINRYSNPGELVFDPFAGLFTVPVMAVKMGRKGAGCELSADYFRDGVGYLQAAERDIELPSLFDVAVNG